MIQEDKELLLKDLCARLSHGVICNTPKGDGYLNSINQTIFDVELGINIININSVHRDTFKLENCKPYLRPMSSMTEEEYNDMFNQLYLAQEEFFRNCSNADTIGKFIGNDMVKYDWLTKKMFDFRYLIPKGLALEAPEEMYKKGE